MPFSIWELESENFKKLNVKLKINGKAVTITGKNETGKSSFIDAIFTTLTKQKIKGVAIQLGKNEAKNKITLKKDTGEIIIVERTFTDSKTSLKVTKNGVSIKGQTPQQFLDEVLSYVSFDPLEFVNKKPLEQKRFLMEFLKLDLEKVENEKRTYLDELNVIEKDMHRVTGELQGMVSIDKEYSFIDSKNVVNEFNKINELKVSKEKLNYDMMVMVKNINDLTATNEKLYKEMCRIKSSMESNEKLIESLKVSGKKLKDEIATIIIPETDLETKLREIEKNNEFYRIQQERTAKIKELEQIEIQKTDVNGKIKKLEKDRTKQIEAVKMPIEGLEFTEFGLSYNGLPFAEDNVSMGRRIEIGVMITAALNPSLPIVQIKDASLLDEDMKSSIDKFCSENKIQPFYEVVTAGKEIGFEINQD